MLRSIRSETKSAMILITHDLGVVAGVADRVLVMYAGKAVELGDVEEIFRSPQMPYTVGLLASLPSMDARRGTLTSIPGTPPSGTNYGPGCALPPAVRPLSRNVGKARPRSSCSVLPTPPPVGAWTWPHRRICKGSWPNSSFGTQARPAQASRWLRSPEPKATRRAVRS